MQDTKALLSREKYKLPNHWLRSPLQRDGLLYFGYVQAVLAELPGRTSLILDAGCGDGRVSSEMVRLGHSVVGIDLLELPIIYARSMVPEARFVVGDLRKDLIRTYDGFEPQQFDAVVMVEVYEHIPPEDCPAVLQNANKVLKAGGSLILSVPSRRLPASQLHYRHFSEEEVTAEVEAAQFSVQRVVYQHVLNRLSRMLLSDQLEALFDNNWIQPVFLKRWREQVFMRILNIGNDPIRCGRYIVVARPIWPG